MSVTLIAELITAFGVLAGAFVTVFTWFRRITETDGVLWLIDSEHDSGGQHLVSLREVS